MNSDFFIYPAVKTAVSAISTLLAVCAAICALCITLSTVLLFCTFFFPGIAISTDFFWVGNFPFSETVCVFEYVASICLLILSPWCVQVLLAGSGSPPIRFFSRACLFFIPIGPFLSGFDHPVIQFFSYYVHLIGGNLPYEEGFYLMQAFSYIGNCQCAFAVFIAIASFRYTKGYPSSQRRLLLCWIICWIIDALIHTTTNYLPGMAIISMILLPVTTILQTLFWIITAWFAWLLAANAHRIAGMPELHKYLFGKK